MWLNAPFATVSIKCALVSLCVTFQLRPITVPSTAFDGIDASSTRPIAANDWAPRRQVLERRVS